MLNELEIPDLTPESALAFVNELKVLVPELAQQLASDQTLWAIFLGHALIACPDLRPDDCESMRRVLLGQLPTV